jgi:hypothetical protein
VRDAGGAAVLDDTVTVDLADVNGRAVTSPSTIGGSPADAVRIQNGIYHANIRTDGLPPAEYVLRARFGSVHVLGELRRTIVLR